MWCVLKPLEEEEEGGRVVLCVGVLKSEGIGVGVGCI